MPTPGRNFSIDLIELTDSAAIVRTVGSIPLASGESYWTDAFRCIKSFCLFTTSTLARPQTSFLYNVSIANAAVHQKINCPGICRNLHVDFMSGNAYTLSINGTGVGTSVVTVIKGGLAIPVADITTAVGVGGWTNVGQTTHCSNVATMYVGVNRGGATKDVVIGVNLTTGMVESTVTLTVPLFTALWATCDYTPVIGGVTMESPVLAGFGTVDGTGRFNLKDTVGRRGQ